VSFVEYKLKYLDDELKQLVIQPREARSLFNAREKAREQEGASDKEDEIEILSVRVDRPKKPRGRPRGWCKNNRLNKVSPGGLITIGRPKKKRGRPRLSVAHG
jgi:hypothetical protein